MSDPVRDALTQMSDEFAASLAKVRAALPPDGPPPADDVVLVQPGDTLPALLEQGVAGTTYLLPHGGVFAIGDFVCPKPCSIVGAGLPTLAPTRLSGSEALPILKGRFETAAPDVQLRGIALEGTNRDRDLCRIHGDRFVLDRVRLTGTPTGQRHGLALGGVGARVSRSRIENIFYQGNADVQAIGLAPGCKDVVVDDCFLEAAGINVIAGGSDIGTEDRMVQDVLIAGCHLYKRPAWRGTPGLVKNLFELKAALRVTLRGCVLENSWVDAQVGYGILLNVRNQYGRDPFVTIQDVLIEDCTLKGSEGGLTILGRDDRAGFASVPLARVTIRNLAIEQLGTYGGNGRTIRILGGPSDVTLDNVTVSQAPGAPLLNTLLELGNVETPIERLTVRGGSYIEGAYGIKGASTTPGIVSLERFAPGYVWEGVTVQRSGVRYIPYPPGTTLLAP